MPEQTFYWFDYETFGTHPIWDRPCQFAGVRTDENLNIIGEPLVIYCRQSPDYLPNPHACRVTGLSPQAVNEKGVSEAQFISTILAEIGRPGTCSVGYNNIRFDDEFTRHTLFRNFHDPYEYEWKDSNSRWDLLDVVRLNRALRPDGIVWPVNEDGSANNRLEQLSKANDIEHSNAHDALSDVYATLGMARLIRQHQPKLFDYTFANRGKQAVAKLLDPSKPEPCLLVSIAIPSSRHHTGVVLPLARLTENQNRIIVLDLHYDPAELATLTVDEMQERMASTTRKPTGGEESERARLGLRVVQINKCPVVVPRSVLRESDAHRLNIDLRAIDHHMEQAMALFKPETIDKIQQTMAFRDQQASVYVEAEGTLYTGGFLSRSDKERCATLRNAAPVDIHDLAIHFENSRLRELALRYQARNYPDSLDENQALRWREHCHDRLLNAAAPSLSLAEFDTILDEIQWSEEQQSLYSDLRAYAQLLRSHAELA
ncbi:MAG: exodeoxyribonuclease I [Granulosicoccus sp.]